MTFQQSGTRDSPGYKLNSLSGMYESSGSQFFRTRTKDSLKQSGLDTFDESRFVMTFLTILGVT